MLERLEIFLPQLGIGDLGWGSVLTGNRHSVGHIVLDAGGNVEAVHLAWIVALKAEHSRLAEFGIEVAVLAEALPHTRPERLAAKVHHRREGPGNQGGAGLICADAAHIEGKPAFKTGGNIDFLREEGSPVDIGSAVDLIQAVEARDADFFNGLALDFPYDGDIFLLRRSAVAYNIEYGADLVFAEYRVHQLGDEMLPFAVHQHADRKLGHLAYLLLKGEAVEDGVYPALHLSVLPYCRSDDAPAVAAYVFEFEILHRIVVWLDFQHGRSRAVIFYPDIAYDYVFHPAGRRGMLVLSNHYGPGARAHMVKIKVLRSDGAYQAGTPLFPIGRGHLVDGEGSAHIIFLNYGIVFEEDAGFHLTVRDMGRTDRFIARFRADYYASREVGPNHTAFYTDIAQVLDWPCVVPYLEGDAVIVAAQQAVLDEHIPGADHIDAVTVEYPVDEVDVFNPDIRHIVNRHCPARGVDYGDILDYQIAPSCRSGFVAFDEQFSAGPARAGVRQACAADYALPRYAAVVALDFYGRIEHGAIVNIEGLSFLKTDFAHIVFARAEIQHRRVVRGRFVRVRQIADQEEIGRAVIVKLHGDFPVGGAVYDEFYAVVVDFAGLNPVGSRAYGYCAEGFFPAEPDTHREVRGLEQGNGHSVAKSLGIVPVVPDFPVMGGGVRAQGLVYSDRNETGAAVRLKPVVRVAGKYRSEAQQTGNQAIKLFHIFFQWSGST